MTSKVLTNLSGDKVTPVVLPVLLLMAHDYSSPHMVHYWYTYSDYVISGYNWRVVRNATQFEVELYELLSGDM